MGRGRERAAEGSWDGYTEHGEITEANEIEAVQRRPAVPFTSSDLDRPLPKKDRGPPVRASVPHTGLATNLLPCQMSAARHRWARAPSHQRNGVVCMGAGDEGHSRSGRSGGACASPSQHVPCSLQRRTAKSGGQRPRAHLCAGPAGSHRAACACTRPNAACACRPCSQVATSNLPEGKSAAYYHVGTRQLYDVHTHRLSRAPVGHLRPAHRMLSLLPLHVRLVPQQTQLPVRVLPLPQLPRHPQRPRQQRRMLCIQERVARDTLPARLVRDVPGFVACLPWMLREI